MATSTSGPEREDKERLPSAERDAAAEHRVQVAAARLRVVLDERLGRSTPASTKELAKESF